MKTSICPQCKTTFRFRSNKKFCSATCRKLNAQQKKRTECPVNATHSPETRRDQSLTFDLAMRLAERLYTLPPSQRLGYLQTLIEEARSGASPTLRRVLTMPKLLRANCEDRHLFWRRSPQSYITITQAADRYCRKFWGAGVGAVVDGEVPEPVTGEVEGGIPQAA